MADTPSQESVVSQTESNDSILNDETATAQAFANLLNKDETAKGSEESETAKLEEEKATLEKDNSDPLLENLDGQEEIVDENDASSENQETLYDVKVDGEDFKVNLQELKKGYQLEKNYTKKNMDLSNKRKDVESLQIGRAHV